MVLAHNFRLSLYEPLLVTLAMWALFGWWAATVCAQRGRSKTEGWMLGLFLGPIGIVVAYLLRPHR